MNNPANFKEVCEKAYEVEGPCAVYDLCQDRKDVRYMYCPQCEADTPVITGDCECLLCGSQVEKYPL
jgi:hypothetical protein